MKHAFGELPFKVVYRAPHALTKRSNAFRRPNDQNDLGAFRVAQALSQGSSRAAELWSINYKADSHELRLETVGI
ncbi:MAG: hypothetical protein R3C30_01000 [Hyphomonadaceae bacterium]